MTLKRVEYIGTPDDIFHKEYSEIYKITKQISEDTELDRVLKIHSARLAKKNRLEKILNIKIEHFKNTGEIL